MVSLLNYITGHKENDLETELYLTFGIIGFIVINLLITIYSHEFSEDIGTKNDPELWIKRRCRASGLIIEDF